MNLSEYGVWCEHLHFQSWICCKACQAVWCWVVAHCHSSDYVIQFIQIFSVHTCHVKSWCDVLRYDFVVHLYSCRKWLICVRFVHLSNHMEKLSSCWTSIHLFYILTGTKIHWQNWSLFKIGQVVGSLPDLCTCTLTTSVGCGVTFSQPLI
jgi:hypothetical protein